MLSSLFSSLTLNCKEADDFKVVNLPYVIGSITQEDNVFTLLSATQDTPAVLSDLPISIHDFGKVSPWLL